MEALKYPATENLGEVEQVADMARLEHFDPDRYAISLAHHIRNEGVQMDVQRERLAALARVGGGLGGASASAQELARHFVILNALFDRLSMETVKAASLPGGRGADAADRLLNAAVKAQRASVAVLSALKVLREEASTGGGGGAAPHPDNGSPNETAPALPPAEQTDMEAGQHEQT
jgi:hypothetical protein